MNSKINILFVHPTPYLNGVSRTLAGLINSLDPAAFQISIAAPPESAFESMLKRPDTVIRHFQMASLGRSPARVLRHFLSKWIDGAAIARFAKQTHAELLFGNTLMASWALDAAARCGLPCVMQVHEGPRSFPPFLYRAWVKRAGRKANLILAVSDEIQEAFRAFPAKVVRMENAIDLKWSDRIPSKSRAAGPGGRDFNILCVSHLMEGKGQHELVNRWAQIVEQCPGARITFVGGANGIPRNEEYLRSLQALAAKLGAQTRIHFVGPQTDLAPWFQACDTFVNTSPYETFGLTLMEALAAGVPVISRRVGVVDELARRKTPGLFVIEESWNELPAVLRQIDISGFPDYRAARSEILKTYRMERQVEQVTALLKSLLQRE